MTTPQTVHDFLRRAFAPTTRGVVGLTEQLLAACGEGDVEIERIGDRCVCRWSAGRETQDADAPLPATAFRTVLARIAALCNEHNAGSVSPYGGDGLLPVGGNPATAVRVTFVNTPAEQRVKLTNLGARAADVSERASAERDHIPA